MRAAFAAPCARQLFDQTEVDTAGLVQRHTRNSTSRVEGTWVPGMKTLFWYKHLTPERTQHLQVVWVFDCDIAVHPSVLPLAQLAGALIATRATVLQPSIQAQVHGTYHTPGCASSAHTCRASRRPRNTLRCRRRCLPATRGRDSTKVLAVIPEEGLVTSDFGLDVMWCAFLRDEFPHRPTCLVTPSATATHLNSHEIEKHMSKEVALKGALVHQDVRDAQIKLQQAASRVLEELFAPHRRMLVGGGTPWPPGLAQPLRNRRRRHDPRAVRAATVIIGKRGLGVSSYSVGDGSGLGALRAARSGRCHHRRAGQTRHCLLHAGSFQPLSHNARAAD